MYRYGPGGFHHPVVSAVLLALLVAFLAALVILAVIAVVRMWRNPPGHPFSWRRGTPPGTPGTPGTPGAAVGSPMDPAVAELRLRYARGDINGEEYAQRLHNLGYQHPPATGPGSDPGDPGGPPGGQAPPVQGS
jgi:hypothetical protein